MLSDALVFALFAYALAFGLALLTAGMIKVIQLATGAAEGAKKAGPQDEAR